MGTFQLLGYYPKKEKAIEEWIKNMGKYYKSKESRYKAFYACIIALWNSFNSNSPTKESEDLI